MPLAQLSDGEVIGYESLVRWVTDDGVVATPDTFLDVASRTGLITRIDERMVRLSIDLLTRLPEHHTVAVNIAAATLASGNLVHVVTTQLDAFGVDPTRLHLEVTETDLINVTEGVHRTMRSLADLGIDWWVDDFGTGYSSIAHLRDLPIHGLKLDQSFTSGVSRADSYATRLARGLAGLARALDLRTVAEGVQSQEQASVLLEQGWEVGQGWLYGAARPAEF
jgi:EAL domain-containing protein (putative c-di-GMP-specific phosphodiesterase class I)